MTLNLNLTSQNIQYTDVCIVDLCWAFYVSIDNYVIDLFHFCFKTIFLNFFN